MIWSRYPLTSTANLEAPATGILIILYLTTLFLELKFKNSGLNGVQKKPAFPPL